MTQFISRKTALLIAALTLAACAPKAPEPKAAPPAAAPAPAPVVTAPTPAGPVLSPEGLGPVRIGMTDAEVKAALRNPAFEVGPYTEEEEPEDYASCHEATVKDSGVYYMFVDGKLARISLSEGATIRTDKGLGIGATEAQVRAAYPTGLAVLPHHYEALPARYLTIKTGANGIRYETDDKQVVRSIHAGGDAIEYVEGCL